MRHRRAILASGLFLTLLVILLYVYPNPFLRSMDLKIYDTFFRTAHQPSASRQAVIVDVDEASLKEFGQWPWPRYQIAELLRQVQALGAGSVGIDLFFPEPDRMSLSLFQEQVKRDLAVDLSLEGVPEELKDNDQILARTLSSGTFVLGYKFLFGVRGAPVEDCLLRPLSLAVVREPGAPDPAEALLTADGVVCNLPRLSAAAAGAGFLDVVPDPDGIVRRIPLVIRYENDGRFYPSLALAAFLEAQGKPKVLLRITPFGVEYLQINGTQIPLDRSGNLLLHFRGGRGTFEYVSAADVINGQVDPERFKDRIILVGSTAAGLEDVTATPVAPAFPGVEVHATVVDNLLRGAFLSRPPVLKGLEFSLILLLGLASTLLFAWSNPALSALFSGTVGLSLSFMSWWLLRSEGTFLSPLYPILLLSTNFAVLTLVRFWQEEAANRRKSRQLIRVQKVTIRSLAALSEARDPQARHHILRTQLYVKALAQHLKDEPEFKDALSRLSIEQLSELVALHDIGKVGVADDILLKPGRLTPEEFEQMKLHTVYGEEALKAAEEELGENSFLRPARRLIATHHERWDGKGYPLGLKGEAIPLEGRLMTIADVYDALISRRVYKHPMSHGEAVELMKEGRATQFDPRLLDAFLEIQHEFKTIAELYPDAASDD